MHEFRQFHGETYGLKSRSLQEIEKGQTPVLMLVARCATRKNERFCCGIGMKVVRTLPDTMSDLNQFTKMVSSCSVRVGVHGAGLPNEIFLPDGAVAVQVVLLG